ncbi:hypothetical protein WBO78_07770 [Bosea sp. CCNWLW174]|uniref:hypothetical protein n=1 Tax=unclassified Bosea (in: a-proteobacteria) TaxID=2653178 RepID=UPI0030155393
MRRVATFGVTSCQREPEPRITLVRKDSDETVNFNAATLIAQYQLPSGDIVLILDEDCPYEEQLHLALVRGSDVLDHIVIGAPYATGDYREVALGEKELRFRFSGDTELLLAVRDKASHLPERLPAGARRLGRWFSAHHLSLQQSAPNEHQTA